MELAGSVEIAAARTAVWAALNDPAVLARCIDGVESLDRQDTEAGPVMSGKMHARVGPVRATFAGQVTLKDIVAPESYVLSGEGKGGLAGFAKGEAAVVLAELGLQTTRLDYKVSSSVGGKLAQLGARLIEGTAKGYAETFFARLKAELEAPVIADAENPAMLAEDAEAPAAPAADMVTTPMGTPATSSGVSPLVWGGVLVVLVLLFLAWRMM